MINGAHPRPAMVHVMKPAVILALCCCVFVGCRTRTSLLSEVVNARIEQIQSQDERIEQLAVQLPVITPESLKSVQAMKVAFADYVLAVKKEEASLAASGVVLDVEYYRSKLELLDSLYRQRRQIEEMLTNARM